MYRKLFCSGFALALILGISACEKHEWESTKKLHQPHGGHGHGHDEASHDRGDGHDKKDKDHHQEKDGDSNEGAHGEKERESVAKPRDLGTE